MLGEKGKHTVGVIYLGAVFVEGMEGDSPDSLLGTLLHRDDVELRYEVIENLLVCSTREGAIYFAAYPVRDESPF